METLGTDRFMVFDSEHEDIVNASGVDAKPGLPLSSLPAHEIRSYCALLKKVAALSFYNSRFRILFRGQAEDHFLNVRGTPGERSSLYPSILRPVSGMRREDVLDERFAILASAEGMLTQEIRTREILQSKIVRWAVLQHYGVCPTPLLDVTPSIQMAVSFALSGGRNSGYLYALAFPQLTGPVSVSLESMTQVVDLSQTCPPEALRPHFQVGMLVSDYPEFSDRESTHGKRGMVGNNYACRLLSKFRLADCDRWGDEGFTRTPESILFPNDADAWYQPLCAIRSAL